MRRELRRTFGLSQLRDGQRTVIESVMEGRHTLALMPTGAGKSLCYQLPALLLPGRTVVVSPLIALMKDQCDALREVGVAAVQFNSAQTGEAADDAERALDDGSARIVFVTPERLADAAFVARLARHPVSLLAVDEAHCISQWGHDFRPAFLEIGPACRALGAPTVLALTATAAQEVVDDVAAQLALADMRVVDTGVYRANLHYRVEPLSGEDAKLDRALALVAQTPGPTLIYAATVKAVEAVHEALDRAGESVTRYHGRLAAAERRASQNAFMAGDKRVMVATNAFGLGIDKPDVRFVLHFQMPGSLDAYYQESGRGGRDGEDAVCTLLYLARDKAVQQFFLAGRYPQADDVRAVLQVLRRAPPDAEASTWTLAALQRELGRARSKLQVALTLLRRQRVAVPDRDGGWRLARTDFADDAVNALVADYRERRERDRDMLERMVFYAQTGHCRWRVLLEHFDEAAGFERCGHCDNCARRLAHEIEQADSPAVAPADGDADTSNAIHSPHARFAKGEAVRVPRYGQGIVEAADPASVTVSFASGDIRSFLPDFVRTVRSSGARRRGTRIAR